MKKKPVIFALFLFCGLVLSAQKSIGIMKMPGMPVSGIPAKTLDTLLRSAEKAFFSFQTACNLKDAKTGTVTASSMERYLSLFEFNANVPQDFLFVDNPPEIKSPDYATFVYEHLKQGLDNRFVSAEFTSVNYDSLGFYRVYARMVKQMKIGLKPDMKTPVLKTKDSCVVLQTFTFFIERSEMGKAKIFKIQQSGKINCIQDRKFSISLYGAANYGTGSSPLVSNNYWPSQETKINFEGKAVQVKGFSAGIIYHLKNKPISVHLGGQYNWMNTAVTLGEFSYKLYNVPDPVDPVDTIFVRGIGLKNISETGRLSVIQAKIGITYWMIAREKFDFGFDFLVMPGKVMYFKRKFSTDINYYSSYTYPTPVTGNQFEVVIDEKLPNSAYQNGIYTFEDDSLGYLPKIFIGAQIAPVFNYHLNDHFSVRLSGYFHFSITDWFNQSEAPNKAPFGKGSSDMQSSLISEYIDGYKIQYFGANVGLQYRF